MDNNSYTPCKNETYLFLDFNGKLSLEQLQNKIFLRIANLHQQNPLIQLNDTVFKGSYDHSLGTNLFFEEENAAASMASVLSKQRPIYLKHTVTETKVVNLKQMRVPPRKADIPGNSSIKNISYNFDWEYNELLKMFEEGRLDLKDLTKVEMLSGNEQVPDTTEEQREKKEVVEEINESKSIILDAQESLETSLKTEEQTLWDIKPAEILEDEYTKLQLLARRPVKRLAIQESVTVPDHKYKDIYEYDNIERQVLYPTYMPSTVCLKEVNEETLAGCVDIDRCIMYGIIQPLNNFPRILSSKEKKSLLTLDNFDNLSLPARLYVLKSHTDDLENYIKHLSQEKLKIKDEYGKTPVQTLEIYKKLTRALERRIREIYTLEQEKEENEDKPSDTLQDI